MTASHREKRTLHAKVMVTLALESALAPGLIVTTVLLGRAPESLLWLQNVGRRIAIRWMMPGLRSEKLSLKSLRAEFRGLS